MNETITIKWRVTQKMTGRSVETGSRCIRLVNVKREADVYRQTALMLTRTWPACAYEIVITTEVTK